MLPQCHTEWEKIIRFALILLSVREKYLNEVMDPCNSVNLQGDAHTTGRVKGSVSKGLNKQDGSEGPNNFHVQPAG